MRIIQMEELQEEEKRLVKPIGERVLAFQKMKAEQSADSGNTAPAAETEVPENENTGI